MSSPPKKNKKINILIFGVGNPLRGDDGIGSEIAKDLRQLGYKNVIDAEDTPENYILKVLEMKPKKVIVLDACHFGGSPGEFRLFKEREWEKILNTSFSTHTLPISLFMSLFEKGGIEEVYLLGIQAQSLAFNQPVSPEVKEAKRKVIDFLEKIISQKE